MKLLQIAFKRETIAPMLALIFASGVSVFLVFARIVFTEQLRYGFLIWNLFLAWMPLVFALLAAHEYRPGARQSLKFLALGGAWFVFFPNAPYIFTDLIHLPWFYAHFWVDMVLILICALTGLVLGFLSLYLMQSVVARAFGRLASWLFIAVVTGSSGFGIYLGRFLRFNSWDVVVQPMKVYHGVGTMLANHAAQPASLAFPVLFGTFLFVAYLLLYALTNLQSIQPAGMRPPIDLSSESAVQAG